MLATQTPSDRLAPKSTLRHRPIASDVRPKEPPRIPRASRTPNTTTPVDVPVEKSRPRPHRWQRVPMIAIGSGMTIAILAIFLGQFLVGWSENTWNDLHYGYPRTFQTDAFVGHESGTAPSHFLALNLHGQVEIIELPGGDVSRAKIYLGPHLYGPHSDLTPITLSFVDIRHDHHPDMLVSFQGSQLVFQNTQDTFHAPSSLNP